MGLKHRHSSANKLVAFAPLGREPELADGAFRSSAAQDAFSASRNIDKRGVSSGASSAEEITLSCSRRHRSGHEAPSPAIGTIAEQSITALARRSSLVNLLRSHQIGRHSAAVTKRGNVLGFSPKPTAKCAGGAPRVNSLKYDLGCLSYV